MSKPVDAWRTASMKLKAPFGQLSPKDKKMNVMEAFKDQKERGLKDEVSDFFTETSFTALVRIYKATSLAKRLMWTLMVLFMVSWLVVQCYWLLDKYFKYPIEVKMDFTSANQLEFPSVTVCNLNPILESKLGDPMFESLNKYKTIKTEDTLYQQTIDNWHFSGSCESSQHQCSNGQCIEMHWVCDGYDDCSNGDDEAHCDTWSCTSSQFKCNDNKCIPKDWECDRYNDCSEGEDEPTTCVYATTPSYMRGSSNPSISHSSTFTTPSGTDKTADETGTTTDDTGTSSGDTATTIDDTGATTEEPDTTTDDTDTTTEDTDTTTEGPNTTTEGPDTTTVETHQSTTAESETTTPDSMPGKKRRKRREVMDEMMDKKPFPEHGDAGGPDSPRFFRDLLDKLEMKQAMMKEDTKARLEYQHFVRNNIRPLLKERRDSMADIRRMEESLQPLLRKKRSEKASRTVEEVDWAQVLTSSDFNRWDSLTGNDSNAFYTERDEEYEATMTYAYITAVMDEAEVEPSGHAKNDFIASCKFGGYQCSPQNFTYFHNYKYGNCFTFNTIGHNVDLYTKFPGPSNGLILELFLDSDEYVANLSPGKGARVTVHKKGTSPFPEDEGFSVISGLSVNIGMRQVKMSRVSPPYGACKDLGETEDYYMTRKGFDYSKLSCLKSCYQDIILDFCNCQTPLYFVRPDLPVCNLTNVIVDNCVLSLPVLKPLRYTECDEKCPVPCSETKYETSFSMAQWPTQKAEPFIKQRLAKSNAKYAGVDEIQEEFTRVQIYFVDLMYQYVEQQKAYESMNLISDLGGQLGLWLGLSAITLGELCSFMFSLGRSLPHMCCNANNKKGVVEPSNRQPATLEDMYNEMRLKDLEDAPEVVTTDTSVFTDSKKTPG